MSMNICSDYSDPGPHQIHIQTLTGTHVEDGAENGRQQGLLFFLKKQSKLAVL